MATGLWTKEQIKLAFHLYCQLPYGRIHGRNPEIMALAKVIGRTAIDDSALENDVAIPDDFTGETRQALTTQRIKQHFFSPRGTQQLPWPMLHVGAFRQPLADCQPHRAVEQRQGQPTQPQLQ
jgi:hypothetical protein